MTRLKHGPPWSIKENKLLNTTIVHLVLQALAAGTMMDKAIGIKVPLQCGIQVEYILRFLVEDKPLISRLVTLNQFTTQAIRKIALISAKMAG